MHRPTLSVMLPLILLILGIAAAGCHKKELPADNPVVVNKALYDTASNFYVEFNEYPAEMRNLPIGIFDSGTGGLTVLEKLLSLDSFDNITGSAGRDSILDFAGEHFIYLADQANMPYGNYEAEGNSDYLKELVLKDALFLMDDDYFTNAIEERPAGRKPRAKIIVVACNTATAYGLDLIRSMLEQSGTGVKVIGVIDAGVSATLDELDIKEGDAPFAIGVLATPGTIATGAYERTLRAQIEERGITTPIDIVNQSGYGFAEAVDSDPDYVNPLLFVPSSNYRGPALGEADGSIRQELIKAYNFDFSDNKMLARRNPGGGYASLQLNSADNYARYNMVSLLERHRQSGKGTPLRAIILGCTHYPFYLETLNETLAELRDYREDGRYPYRDLIADEITFIDPAVYVAIECYNTLRQDGNLAYRITPTKVDAYISVPSNLLEDTCLTQEGMLTHDFKYGRKPGTEDQSTKQVPFSLKNLDKNNLQRIEERLPYSYELIAPSLK
ncbi:MAG: aspartate/glutamate racemase family protein [Bacteroidales bacterium]|nr:aspartate/glutamate racemase family protein [Bacteroidales bacterium]